MFHTLYIVIYLIWLYVHLISWPYDVTIRRRVHVMSCDVVTLAYGAGPDNAPDPSSAPAFFRPQKSLWVRWLLGNHIPPSSSKRAGSDTQMGLRRAHSLAWILSRRYFLPSSYFWSGGSFEAFENALSNFVLWADIFISALKGVRAIQNFDL